ncbi:heme o synthase [Oceanobacter mangrovi]|uniref:heme o synthase n=1 Tax=Oceanobacter mangrovi TaxID=2862510 RepID=UPI001C8DC14B|nr:heme o synthase [Oceanobacter mangrovi]
MKPSGKPSAEGPQGPFKRYLTVTKPGIIMGNLIASAGGFFLASRGEIDYLLLLATVVGLSLVVASGCAINNGIDRDIDGHMQRTRNRVTVTGEMSVLAAVAHGVVLGLLGFGLLAWQTNTITVLFAAFGFVVYVGLYSLWLKRSSVYGTLIGSLSGAVPPVVGYCAVTGSFDVGAGILLLMFCLWQMPHSYAIAIFRYDDYKAAGIPVLPVAQGIGKTKLHMVLYIIAFGLVTVLLTATGYAGYGYLAVACVTSLWWLVLALKGWQVEVDNSGWAKQVFMVSIVTITALSIAMAVDFHSPAQHWLTLG